MKLADGFKDMTRDVQVPLVLSADVLASLSDGFELSSSSFADSRCFLSSSTCPKTLDLRFRLFTLLDLDRKPFAIVDLWCTWTPRYSFVRSWGLELVNKRLRCI